MNDTRYKFYCVGYSVMKYFLNDEPFSSLESHKAERISEDIIVTFLPEDVVDGLYAAVGMAGLTVANMTLEPIAAINVAIPENYRLLNIALVDIGAGTSDISVTRDGSIIAYGMIPLAGDEITELIVQSYLVDFNTAEQIKLSSGMDDQVTYKDIMMIEHTIPSKDVWKLTEPVVDKMTTEVAAKIKELNGDKSVSAAFIVGGGGKIHGYTEMLAKKLDLPAERVALRGEEVLQEVTFLQTEIQKDPLLVTPIGICLNYYDQRNSFIMVRFNGERIKLYDNNKLTIVDAALQAGFPNEELFPKRGKELNFTVNGTPRIVRGELGESAEIYMNDRLVNINTPLEPNSDIVIEASTQGEAAVCTLEQLDEYSSSEMKVIVNGRIVRCPKCLEVNGSLELPSYEIKEGDAVETRSFYTVEQLAAFMDVEVDMDHEILVNNRVATMESLVYENFSVDWVVLSFGAAAVDPAELPVAEQPVTAAAGGTEQTAEDGIPTLPTEFPSTRLCMEVATEQVSQLGYALEQILSQMQNLAKTLPEYQTIRQMGGMGEKLCVRFIADIGDVRRFHNGKALVAYAGIDAPPYQSGQYTGTKRRISKRGNSALRKTGYEVMKSLKSHPPKTDTRVYDFIIKKENEGKSKKQAKIAGLNKFLQIYYARVMEIYKNIV